ncbi:MAG: hypothetical protein O2960_08525 [Verrucomicrobia bacterium]|nr:hypothetical protein [Verrucomicrobiota bacterium]
MAEEYAGAGLEASTVQRLAEVRETLLRHGGAVTFDASEYRGTRLNAYIPVTS